mmetsp:Transcript_14312/g.36206  ORF Transcript_14312/g.36206 Transcript_14312/m.36206 type:complete len:245 (+) Transcript_14312:85-819(+)
MASTAGARGLAAWAVRTRTWAGNISPGAHHATRAAAAHATKHAATPRGGGHGHGQDTWDHTTTRASHTHAQVPGQHQCALPGPFAVKGLGVGARRGMAALPEVDVELPPSCTRIGSIEGPYEPPSSEDKKFFAVVEVGAQQFKVTADDLIFTEKLKGVDVNDKVRLDRVLLVGSKDETVIGRPFIPTATVIAAVEEQFRDGKVLVFKKKRRNNYRRTQGHRQHLTALRILEISNGANGEASAAE